MTDYEIDYQRCATACGEPFAEVVAFFDDRNGAPLTVLDLGCGQGRDALMIAARGHRVHGVDIAPSGIAQMLDNARRSGWDVTAELADLSDYRPHESYDVVILDRVVHMMVDAASKRGLLATAASAVAPRGWALVVETPSNLPMVEAAFPPDHWERTLRRKGFRFYCRHGDGDIHAN